MCQLTHDDTAGALAFRRPKTTGDSGCGWRTARSGRCAEEAVCGSAVDAHRRCPFEGRGGQLARLVVRGDADEHPCVGALEAGRYHRRRRRRTQGDEVFAAQRVVRRTHAFAGDCTEAVRQQHRNDDDNVSVGRTAHRAQYTSAMQLQRNNPRVRIEHERRDERRVREAVGRSSPGCTRATTPRIEDLHLTADFSRRKVARPGVWRVHATVRVQVDVRLTDTM